MRNDRAILILGEPDSGKTHFGGQLIHRLKAEGNAFEMVSPPDDYGAFQDVMDALSDGKSVGHTASSYRKSQFIKIKAQNGFGTTLVFPDYAGERVRKLVQDRRLDADWTTQIAASQDWLLILSLKDQPREEDMTNHPIHSLGAIGKGEQDTALPELAGQTFYFELLQMLLFAKKVDCTHRLQLPRLTVLLSLWDILGLPDDKQPLELLRERMPLLVDFLCSNWHPDSLTVLGLSSLGKDLKADKVDEDYQNQGCTEFGYLVLPNGQKEKDLTCAIHYALGTQTRD